MYRYAITKYNPQFRDSNGRYLKEDWTAVSDIGKTYNNELLTIESYKHVEDSYAHATDVIMDYLAVPYLSVSNVVKSFPFEMFRELTKDYRVLYTEEIMKVYTSANSLTKLEGDEVGHFVRLMLREDLGAKLFFEDKLRIFIGYDYLMGAHSLVSLKEIIPIIESTGLYMEEF